MTERRPQRLSKLTPRAGRSRSAFTLIEVVVALGAMTVIGLLSWQALAGSLKARDFLEREEAFQRSANTALSRIQHHLELAYLTKSVMAVNTYQTVFVAKDGGEEDELWFSSLGHHRRFRDSKECDQTELTFWLDDDPENDGDYVLLMREAQRIDERPDEDGGVLPLAHAVKRFDLHFLDPTTGEWIDEWDSTGADQNNRLPRAVQVVLVLDAPGRDDPEDKEPRAFVRTVQLAFADTLNRENSPWSSTDDQEAAQ